MKKQITAKHPEGFIRIKISTDGCVPNKPYFSITGDIHSRESFSDSSFICGGCIHDEISSIRPDLKPFVDLHLSDLDGVPMHAEENGFYWLAKAAGIPQEYGPDQDEETCFKFFCNHCRISESEGREIVRRVAFSSCVSNKHRSLWNEICESMKPRWKQEAQAAISLLESL
jgi:hypothetical protein